VVVTFALLTCYILPATDISAAAPNDPDKAACNPNTDTDCFPYEIMVNDNPLSTHLLILDSQTTNNNTPNDSSADIEADGLVVKVRECGTAGEVPGKPGFCKK